MTQGKAKIQCPGCELRTQVAVKKPGICTPTVVPFKCSSCGSQCIARLTKPKGSKDPQAVIIATKLAVESPALRQMREEQRQHNEAEGAV